MAQQVIKQDIAGFYDFRCGAEVVIHDDVRTAGCRNIIPDLFEHADIGAPEPVDGLFCVSYDKQIPTQQFFFISSAEQIHQFLLFLIGILEFIHHDELEAAAAACQHLRIRCQHFHSLGRNETEADHFLLLGCRK